MQSYPPITSTLRPLFPYRSEIDVTALSHELKRAWRQLLRSEHWKRFKGGFRPDTAQSLVCIDSILDHDTISATLKPKVNLSNLRALCEELIPWRIGPFKLGELEIDAEWRSDIKWRRIATLLPKRSGLRIADIGCSNGYFLFKLASLYSELAPELALGFDPVDRCWLQFALLQSILKVPNLGFVPVGLSALTAFPRFFDLIVCMGVMYHQRDPHAAVRQLFESLRPGGTVLIESLVIDQPGSFLLLPPERYAKMRNAWIIPTADALATLLERAGFKNVCVHRFGPITPMEQRRTTWAPYESLADFLDPNDHTKTIEGHPAPHSAVVTGEVGLSQTSGLNP